MSISKHQETLIQHVELEIVTDRLRLIASAPSDALPEVRMRSLLEYEFSFLAETLDEHLVFEESGGYMADLVERHPELAENVKKLEREHAEIRNSLKALNQGVKRLPVPELKQDLGKLLDRLATHEIAERHLLMNYVADVPEAGD